MTANKSRYFIYLKFLAVALWLTGLAGCATMTGQPGLIIDGLIFRNQTDTIVHNVQVQVRKTSAFSACSPVLAGNECTTTFRPVSYQGNAIAISWEQNGQAYKTEEFHAALPTTIVEGKNARVIVVIGRSGRADASLVQ